MVVLALFCFSLIGRQSQEEGEDSWQHWCSFQGWNLRSPWPVLDRTGHRPGMSRQLLSVPGLPTETSPDGFATHSLVTRTGTICYPQWGATAEMLRLNQQGDLALVKQIESGLQVELTCHHLVIGLGLQEAPCFSKRSPPQTRHTCHVPTPSRRRSARPTAFHAFQGPWTSMRRPGRRRSWPRDPPWPWGHGSDPATDPFDALLVGARSRAGKKTLKL